MTTFFSNIKTISIHDKNKAQIRNEAIEAYNAKQRIYKKMWRKENKEYIRKKHKEWRDKNKDKCVAAYTKRNLKLQQKIQCPFCLKSMSKYTFKYGSHKNYIGCSQLKK